MASDQQQGDVTVSVDADFVATVELHRPPDNYFDLTLIRALADVYLALDADPGCRAIVLAAEGKHFCAGANLGADSDGLEGGPSALYREAVRVFEAATPVVAAVHGAAVGGGLGLACSADFRVGCPEARFAANFARLGFHHGFGLSVTLPPIVGQQRSLELLYTGRRIGGEEAARIGLCDRLVPAGQVRAEAHALAAEIAGSAPLAVRSIRATMRGHLAGQVRVATDREAAEQDRLRVTADWAEGVAAMAQRRPPRFEGR
jgi:2-(1,2-epoxy-1,2-dihydrophenyl)acetyl-CoA isomerase